ncbi:MAG: hypothetical protein LGB07_03330 [Sulfurovum sp.]|nr:hypothetical protein [Sulfurovum sp.]MCB4746017.1 hypothetical protein [Sulfurovum sp.]MCB4750900.1 hypothetical protein [Sulfurovum sp.]MCB4773953.1 hypothetical protein [Sulfurovum sp.]MCB4775607.1 hypothetical protein [Sulfurovum sp.]
MNTIIIKSFKDIFSSAVLLFIFKVGMISTVITWGLIWLLGDILKGFIINYLGWIPWEWAQTTGASIAIVAVGYMLFILTLSVVTSFMIEPLLIMLAQKHYPYAKVVNSSSVMKSTILSIRSGLSFFFLFLFLLPLMFIPLIGAIWMLWLWSIPIKDSSIYDIQSLFMPQEQKIEVKNATVLAMVAAIFNYIPILNIFTPVFAEIIFLHTIIDKENK